MSRLRLQSLNPLVYVELPGAQHSADLVHSIRTAAIVDGLEAFAGACAQTRTGSVAEPLRATGV